MGRDWYYRRQNFAAKLKTTCNKCLEKVVLIRDNDGNMQCFDADEVLPHTCRRTKGKKLNEFKAMLGGQLQLPNVLK